MSHIDSKGRARMVDVSRKATTERWAKAQSEVHVNDVLFARLKDNTLKKGDALTIARIAGIQAAKKTAELIPLCHPLPITHIEVEITLKSPNTVLIKASARTKAATGIEMEALTAAGTAALTIFDMGKSIDRSITIKNIKLVEKGGGKTGLWQRETDE